MKSTEYITEIDIGDMPYLSRGIRTYLGYGLLDTKKIGLYHGLVGNWECGSNLPNKENWNRIKQLVKSSGKSYDELIGLGKKNFGDLIGELSTKSKIPEQIFLRYVISKCLHLNSSKKLEDIKKGKSNLSKKTKKKVLEIWKYIEENQDKDPRRIIIDLQRRSIFSDRNLFLKILFSGYIKSQKKILEDIGINFSSGYISSMFHDRRPVPNILIKKLKMNNPKTISEIEEKINSKDSRIHQQWQRVSRYNSVIDLHYKNEEFEEKVFNIIDKIGKYTVKNGIVSDNGFNYIGEVDIISKINGKTIFFLCKNTNSRKLINIKRDIVKKSILLQKYINPYKIILVTSCLVSKKDYFERNKLLVIDKKKLYKIQNNLEGLVEFVKNKGNYRRTKEKIDFGREIPTILKKYKLSKYQLGSLLNMNGGYLSKIIKTGTELNKTSKLKKRLEKFLKESKNKTIREVHLLSNRKIHLKKEEFILKYVRKKLGLSQQKVSKDLKTNPSNIGNLERGLVKRIKFKHTYIQYLKSFNSYNKLKKQGEKEFVNYKKKWNHLPKSGKITKIRDEPVRGRELEEFTTKILENNGFFVIRNVVVTNKDLTLKQEIDIYAKRKNREIVIECKDTKMSTKWQDISYILKDIKTEVPIDEVIYLSPHITKLGKDILKEIGIIGLTTKELKNYLCGGSS
ncbi:hypothetical protein HYV89_00275 [Candidatus Woesearchaeota archaeon]|nr:hypothetical protein [Candidatus Woesearchaeota archaeon]